MGRMSRSAVAALAVTGFVALGGCSSDPTEQALADRVEVSKEITSFCDAARANIEAAKPLNALNAKGPAPHPADEIEAAVAPLRESNQTMLDSAPVEVRPDAELAFTLAELQLDIYERTGGDPAAVTADATYVAKVQEADGSLKRMQGFLRTACGVDAG
ncbi:MAG: hypothetical protein ACT4RN_19170 [Pseudonocardia sp.]